MARPREFDEQEVIDRAVDVFWRKGFADTSIRDLEKALGMGRQSIYNTFGDKRALFVRALQIYHERGASFITATFSAQRGLDSIYTYFDLLIEGLTRSEEKRGCFLTKCMVDHGVEDIEVASRCKSNEQHMVDVFKKALEEAIEDKTLAPLDLCATSSVLATQVYGLSVMARAGASREALKDSTQTLLKHLIR